MALKIYRSKTGIKYNLLLEKANKTQVQVEFRGSNKEYRTYDEEIQKLIENGKYFTGGKIELFQTLKDDERSAKKASEATYTNVTDMQGVIDILVDEYKLKAKDLKDPESIKKAAKECNASFPNVEFKSVEAKNADSK